MPNNQSSENASLQAQNEELREQIETAYAFIEGQKATQSFYTMTPEDCFDRFIERVEGKDTELRPNALNRIERTKNNLLSAIERIKALPAAAFRKPDPTKDVNTE